MTAGQPLTDDDRYPWLETVGLWLADHCGDGGFILLGAKRRYRKQLRKHCPSVRFLHLSALLASSTQYVSGKSMHSLRTA